jgi:hypothetical protein
MRQDDCLVRPRRDMRIHTIHTIGGKGFVDEDGSRKTVPAPAQLTRNAIASVVYRDALLHALRHLGTIGVSSLPCTCFVCTLRSTPLHGTHGIWRQWEFYVMMRKELTDLRVGRSISLATLRTIRPPMSAAQFQSYTQALVQRGSSKQ